MEKGQKVARDLLTDANAYVFISNGVKYWLGPVCDIVSLSQSGNYTEFYICNGQKLMVHGSLANWGHRLPALIFFKTGRDCIVNLVHVKQMQAYDAKRLSFVLDGGNEVVLSRQQSLLFRKLKKL